MLRYFRWPFIVTVVGLALAGLLGWQAGRMVELLFITLVLAVLEISLSFDNAIVNANKLRSMSEIWQRRFLTWGILIAVFGMRMVFPLLIVVIAAGIGPFAAFNLAMNDPDRYAHLVEGAHVPISAFGGAFLMMVALGYFIDAKKDVDWLPWIERVFRHVAHVRGIEAGVVIAILLFMHAILPPGVGEVVMYSGMWGLLTFLVVDIVGQIIDGWGGAHTARQVGLGGFLYLEVLDASFSFDGVIGAFALTKNLLIIMIGLGIGAMYVRAMTVMLVERGTLAHFRFLENGAFWSIFVLAAIMFLQTMFEIPEAVTGLLGAFLIGAALWSSIRWRRQHGDGST